MNDTLFLGEFTRDAAEEKARIEYFDGGPAYRFGFGRYAVRDNDLPHPAHLLRASGQADTQGFVQISIERHLILSYTPSGAWIDTWKGKKFVNLRANKQWASADEAEAIDQLYHRKRSQVRILEARLDSAKTVKANLEKHFGKVPPAPRSYWRDDDY